MINDDLIEKAYSGTVSKEDALQMLNASPFELFSLADELRRIAVGDEVTYVVNRNIYLTNMCQGDCGFCAFKAKKGYILSAEEVLEEVEIAHSAGATEVCVQGGYIKKMGMDYYQEIFQAISSNYPDIDIHALSPMEIHHAAEMAGISLHDACRQLKDWGVGTLTGTSAEILSDRVRKIICPSKLSTQEWIDTVTASHEVGLRTNSTMMYGHVETIEERLDHILILRDIQKKTGGLTELIPMSFVPYNNKIGKTIMQEGRFVSTGMDDLKLVAIARILLHKHVDNIQAPWVKLGNKLAQVALHCGANDLGGTLMADKITTASGGTYGEHLPAPEIEWMIRESGRVPKRRNARYEAVQ